MSSFDKPRASRGVEATIRRPLFFLAVDLGGEDALRGGDAGGGLVVVFFVRGDAGGATEIVFFDVTAPTRLPRGAEDGDALLPEGMAMF